MTQTVQPCSWALIHNRGEDITIPPKKTEDNMTLLIQVFDSLNILCEKLSRLNEVLQKKNRELNTCHK